MYLKIAIYTYYSPEDGLSFKKSYHMLGKACVLQGHGRGRLQKSVVRHLRLIPVNIRNVLKWFKRLQYVFKTYLNPILWFSKHFQVNVYGVMFKNVL